MSFSELPADLLQRIFATLVDESVKSTQSRGPLAELSSAASVCKPWHTAASASHLWTHLTFRGGRCGGSRIDDVAIRAMFSRSSGSRSTLTLDLTAIDYPNVTTSGLIAALEASGGCGGRLHRLSIDGIVPDASGEALRCQLATLSSFLADDSSSDMTQFCVCTATPAFPLEQGQSESSPTTQPHPCGRLCFSPPFCDVCGTAACKDCSKKLPKNSSEGNIDWSNKEFQPCEHMCYYCCEAVDSVDLLRCDRCKKVAFCDDCREGDREGTTFFSCDNCSEVLCQQCIDKSFVMYCHECFEGYCANCLHEIHTCMSCFRNVRCKSCDPFKSLFFCFGCHQDYCIDGCGDGKHAPCFGGSPSDDSWEMFCLDCRVTGRRRNLLRASSGS